MTEVAMPSLMLRLILLLCLSTPALADDATGPLRAMLDRLPAPMLSPQVDALVLFADPGAARDHFQGADGLTGPEHALIRAWPWTGRWSLALNDLGRGWPARVGFAASDVVRLLSWEQPPMALTLIDLPAAGAGALPAALAAAGYRAQGGRWVIGTEGAIDLSLGARDDPFAGQMGQFAVVEPAPDGLHHATAAGALDYLATAPATPGTGDPAVSALLDALPGLDGVLLRAVLAPSRGVLLAEFTDGVTSSGVLVATRPTNQTATQDTYAAQVLARWSTLAVAGARTLADLSGAQPDVSVRSGPDAAVLIRLTLTASETGDAGQTPFNLFQDLLLRGDLARLLD